MNILSIRQEFPQLCQDKNLIYLDNAATTLKPRQVIDCLYHFYSTEYAPVHRSVYQSARKASERFYGVRTAVKQFLSARSEEEIIFTHGTTDSINLVSELLSRNIFNSKSKIIISAMEHHSNIVPWHMAQERTGIAIAALPLLPDDTLNLDVLEKELSSGQTALVSLCHVSNILGTINPIRTIADLCHQYGALLLVDGAQSSPHMLIDVQALGCDFFVCSSHKMYGPTGVGILWAKQEILEKLTPTRGGGGMIDTVTLEKTTYGPLPTRFEPGTQAVAEIIAFQEALSFIQNIGLHTIFEWEHRLTTYVREKLSSIEQVHLIGNAKTRGALQSLSFTKAHPLDVATLLDTKNIAVRSGHMCGQPLLKACNETSLLRVSFGVYNTLEECDIFIEALKETLKRLG